jgi:peptidoglycan L-alanyl-D-glutamate endopeptidase CwlK
MHNYGLAIDCGVFQLKKYLDAGTSAEQKTADNMHKFAGKLAEKHGLRWGGNFKSLYDAPHFELAVEHTVSQLAALRKPGQWVPLAGKSGNPEKTS